MWCPLGPLVYAGCSAAASAASTGGTQGREALSAPWCPSTCPGYALGRGSRTQPAWQHHLCRRQSRSAGLTPCHVPPPSRANRQLWSGGVACPCDVEVKSPGPHLPWRAQCQALQPPCRGLEHQAHTSPRHVRQRRTTMEQAGVPQPPPPPLRHTRAHTHRHGGISRPRAPPRGLGAVNSPVGLVTGHPGTTAQSGPAGKAAGAVGRRPGEAFTQPNPTQPLLLQSPCGPRRKGGEKF